MTTLNRASQRSAEIESLRAGLTDFGRQAVEFWMDRTGCSELQALRYVSGGPRLLQPGYKIGRGWRRLTERISS